MMNKLFLEILNVQSYSRETERMAEYIFDYCLSNNYNVDYQDGNLYVTKGISPNGSYPCIISHTDTVHPIIPDQDYFVAYDGNIAVAYDLSAMSMTGIGGDDKVGIYICLRMLQDLPYCKAAFFRDEEIGCQGSMAADLEFFKDCRFILQCDRKGNKDFVNNIFGTDLYSDEFAEDIKTIIADYGYSESSGGLTDVYQLSEDGVGISVANMSCGYYNPHTDEEMINLHDVENCRAMVFEIMVKCDKVYAHEQVYTKGYATSYTHSGKNWENWYDDYEWKYDKATKSWNKEKEDVNANTWDGWTYNSGKYSKKIEHHHTGYECWSCGLDFPADEISHDGMCDRCEGFHADNFYIDKSKIPF